MKKSIKYLPLLLVLQIFSGCAIQPVEFKRYENLKIDKLSATPSFTLDMIYYNPNSVGATLTKANVLVVSDADTIGIAFFNQSIKLKAKNEFLIPITSLISFQQLIKISGKLLFNSEDLILNFTGTVTVKKFIFKRNYPFSEKQKINTKNLF